MALIKAIVIPPDAPPHLIEVDNDDLATYQTVVGGYLEAITGKIATVYFNEEGLILNLPVNPSASLFAERFLHAGSYFRLHGTALIVGPPDGDGNDTPVRESVVSYYTMEMEK